MRNKLILMGILSAPVVFIMIYAFGVNPLNWIGNLSTWFQQFGLSSGVATMSAIGAIIIVIVVFIGLWQIVNGGTGPWPKILAYLAIGVCVTAFIGSTLLGPTGFDGLLKILGGELSAVRQPFEAIQNGGTPDFSWYQSFHFGHLLVVGLIGTGAWLILGPKKG